jgi:NADH dehydrogenase
VHLNTQVESVIDGRVELSDGQVLETDLLVWTAGIRANPMVTRRTDLPVDEKGRVQARTDLRVGTAGRVYEGAWAAGDDAAVPDVTHAETGATPTTTTPNAQHAVRQGKLLAKNIVRVLRGGAPQEYRHHNLGTVATLGLGRGVFQSGPIVIKGFPAWVIHRGYHVLAIPTWERKWRVASGWLNNLLLGRDAVELHEVQSPRSAFQTALSAPTEGDSPLPSTPAPPHLPRAS